jgi:beta-N-acetylhexosaminidase
MRRALIVGLSGPGLRDDEAAFLAAERPVGAILFTRNCESPEQVRRLTDAIRSAIGTSDALILIDQEGGRVQRLKPPHWRKLPPAACYGERYPGDPIGTLRAAWAVARMTAAELRALGIDTNCAPVLDVPVPGSHGVIGDRAYGSAPGVVTELGRSVMTGLIDGGVVPVIKHVPGHGRARADSHLELPRVEAPREDLERTDFRPFRDLAGAPAAMTAHVVYEAIDPTRPATTSPVVIGRLIRGEFGFDGLLMSDDIGMKALTGSIGDRAAAAVAAGCDVALECSGNLSSMREAAASVPMLDGRSAERFRRCVTITRQVGPYDAAEAEATLAALLPTAGSPVDKAAATSPVESV